MEQENEKNQAKRENNNVITKSNAVFDKFNDLDEVIKFATALGKSNLMSIKDPDTIAQIIIAAGEMNLPVTFLTDNAFALNGKLAFHTKVQRALALRAGITYEVIHDMKPYYQYRLDKDTFIDQDDYDKGFYIELPKNIVVQFNAGKLTNPAILKLIGDKIPVAKTDAPYNYETLIKFTRYMKTPFGYKEINDYGKFTYLDAVNADLVKKDNWKYLREMLFNRAYAAGVRRISPDNGGNVYNVSELSGGEYNDSEVIFTKSSSMAFDENIAEDIEVVEE
jgi:hypothetical protein